MKTLRFIAFMFALEGLSAAQTVPTDNTLAALPPGPWPARTADRAEWTIIIAQKDSAVSALNTGSSETSSTSPIVPAPPAGEIDVVKTSPVVHESQKDPQGRNWDKWYQNGTEVVVVPSSNRYLISRKGARDPFLFQDYSISDFSGFDWLSQNTFRGVEDYDGKKCLYFEAMMQPNPYGDPTLLSSSQSTAKTQSSAVGVLRLTPFPVKAYLDFKTLLPVMLIRGNEMRTYHFLPTAPSQLTMPSQIAAYLKTTELAQQKRTSGPERPF